VIRGVAALGKQGLPDYKHLEESTKQRAILIGFDRDFIINSDLKEKARTSFGVVLIESSTANADVIRRILEKVLKFISKNSIRGRICRASVDKIEIINW
jgi:hypothetical protein